jgi:hypothetical protein
MISLLGDSDNFIVQSDIATRRFVDRSDRMVSQLVRGPLQ